MILVTDTFLKSLWKIKSVTFKNIELEITKQKLGLNNLIKLIDKEKYIIYKWYLLSKKVRLLVYYKKVWDIFIPFYIVKKETKYWYNITSELEAVYFNQLDKSLKDIENKKFRVIK